MDFLEEFILPIIAMLAIGCLIVYLDRENTKEIEIIKKTKEFVIHDNCKEFDEKWYCYEN